MRLPTFPPLPLGEALFPIPSPSGRVLFPHPLSLWERVRVRAPSHPHPASPMNGGGERFSPLGFSPLLSGEARTMRSVFPPPCEGRTIRSDLSLWERSALLNLSPLPLGGIHPLLLLPLGEGWGERAIRSLVLVRGPEEGSERKRRVRRRLAIRAAQRRRSLYSGWGPSLRSSARRPG